MSLDLETLRVFVKVAELGSFTRAGQHLRLSKSRVSLRVQELETRVGSRLLQRTTRAVQLTPDGEQFCERARRLLNDAEELAAFLQAPSALRGRVRLDLPIALARNLVIPRLPEFLTAHPQLELELSTTDRRVDLVQEGFDCVVRIGNLADSGLVARRLGELDLVNCASPSYLLKRGIPRSLADLAKHQVVHYSLRFGADAPSFEYHDGERYRELPMASVITVNNGDAYRDACLAGLGITQIPRIGARSSLASGALVEILPDFAAAPMPIWLVQGHTRNVPKRVRVVMNFLAQLIERDYG
ncbi:MAG TPA: LysR family transcriptional regulator [Polyangiaceae bacterium]|nr:LysR family transcriptional regulator [Polyangiaceae bacterium]